MLRTVPEVRIRRENSASPRDGGRYDRAFGPERPVFGKVRYMSSENTKRKLRLGPYLARYSPEEAD